MTLDPSNVLKPDASRIIIVGGGFAGVALAQCLERLLPVKTDIVVLSTSNHLVFTPMLPEVVGRTISPLQVAAAGRQLTKRARWIEAQVSRIDHSANVIHYTTRQGSAESLHYSQAVLACGCAANMDEIPGLSARGYALKTVIDAIALGNDIIGNFEAAAAEADGEMRKRLLSVVVIGGGFSGVEVAGHIADLMRAIRRYYPELDGEAPQVTLLHGGKALLPELRHDSLSAFTLRKLRSNGITVQLETSAVRVDDHEVQLSSGERIATAMVVSTVGTLSHPLIKDLKLPMEKDRLVTGPDMKVGGTSNLWAIGDCALVPNAHDGHPCPATAQFATQQARQLAQNIRCAADHLETKPFSYHARGILASIGHRNAVAVIYGIRLSGFIAWFLWRGVYLAKLPTLSHKLEVALSWACSIPFPANIVQLRLSGRQDFPAPGHD
jgi:NADH dehydrogenase